MFLEDKPGNFGKQRCWTSIGWGTVSMLSGWLVDYFSYDDVHKNYEPVSYLIMLFMIFNFLFASNITVGIRLIVVCVLILIYMFVSVGGRF